MTYDSVDALHALFADKGFHKKGGESGKASTAAEAAVTGVQRKDLEQSNTRRVSAGGEDPVDLEKNIYVQGFGYFTGASIVLMIAAYGMKVRKTKTRSV